LHYSKADVIAEKASIAKRRCETPELEKNLNPAFITEQETPLGA
jgi:hypothetical protein